MNICIYILTYIAITVSMIMVKYIFLILGEGVDDHGGPYRAAFHTAVGEEPAGLLGLLSPTMNSKSGTGIPISYYTIFHPIKTNTLYPPYIHSSPSPMHIRRTYLIL